MFWSVFLTALVFDQLTKLMATTNLEVDFNHGISFGWFSQLSAQSMTTSLIILAIGVAYIWQKEWRQYKFISGLFWAGVLSNLLDRVLFGGVVDWISLPYVEIKNNLADFYLSIALILLFIQELRSQRGH